MHHMIFTSAAIGIGLAMDAFAVSISNGMTLKKPKFSHCVKTGFFFGIFQMIMPLIGWSAGIRFCGYMAEYAHWIAFILLFSIGGKMIYESVSKKDEEASEQKNKDPMNIKVLTMLAVATSIDALLVGVSFAAAQKDMLFILTASGIIGATTFVLSFSGVKLGAATGEYMKKKAGIFGGVILCIIGTKILLEGLLHNII